MNLTPTLADVGEHEVIGEIIAAAPSALNGDDAAVMFPAAPNTRTVAATDMMVEGRHFRRDWSTPNEIGQKAILENFADVESMGARPIAALLAISAPADTPVEFVRGIAEGIAQRCEPYNAELVGGDLTQGMQVTVTVTAIGHLGGDRPAMTLDRARPGQQLVAHGKIGWSAAGLALLERFGRELPTELAHPSPLIDAHCCPWLDPSRGMIARAAGATAMTDISDSLIRDVGTIAARSGVNIDLDSVAIAPHELLVEAGRALGEDPWRWVLTGGEDHTLVGTTAKEAPSGFRVIGSVNKGAAATVDGKESVYDAGWEAF